MTAKVSVAGAIVHVDNRHLAVWARERGAWKFVVYQPTPIIKSGHHAPRVALMGDPEANGRARRSWYFAPSARAGRLSPEPY